jgi:hypothetical protein
MNFKEWFELNEEKDACYHKVKSRYSVWPSAYASGALVKCRKVGAKNWGNSKGKKSKKKKHMQQESVQMDEGDGLKQRSDAMNAAMALSYNGLDATSMSTQEIIKALSSMKKSPPEGVSPVLFAVRVKMIARESENKNEFQEGTFDLEKERGLKGWFDRNNGKGWIDCKKSRKGHLVSCGRKTAGKGAKRPYPACRPTLSACNKKGVKRKKSSKPISWE